MKWAVAIMVLMTVIATHLCSSVAQETQSAGPIKLLFSEEIGWNVDETTGAKICEIASHDECRLGKLSDAAGGFEDLSSVAVAPSTGDIYVADSGNSRVQEFSATGAFLAMFGWDVNKTKDGNAAAARAEKNVCTEVSGDVCTAGVPGTKAGQLDYPSSVTVDPITGDLYVAEITLGRVRVDKYTSDGRFIWMIGKGVNEATKGDLCTEREIELSAIECVAGVEGKPRSAEPGALKISTSNGNELAVGGPEDLLYIGDEGRVQEFEADGKWKREIGIVSPSPTTVAGVAVDKTGDLYVVYRIGLVANVIRKFDATGHQTADFVIGARRNATVTIHGLAIDPVGRLGVIGGEEGLVKSEEGRDTETYTLLGAVYDGNTGKRISEFTVPIGNDGLAFGNNDEMYVAATDGREVLKYIPTTVPNLVTSPVACEGGGEDETSIVFACLPAESVKP